MLGREVNLKSFDDDIYDRKVIADNLTKIIEAQDGTMVISLDSEWGTGKTTFVTMWKELLDRDEKYSSEFETLYFNAWENDYIKDPLLALFSEIEEQIKDKKSFLRENFTKLKKIIGSMSKIAARVAIKVGTAGVLDGENVNLGDNTEDTILALANQLGDISFKEVSMSKSLRTEFKKVISEMQIQSGKKVIFFIDELDRCRPTFAIELLEVIKHLFNIDNFIFVISIDKEQLSHSVATIYGQKMDTVGYLRRFFDLDYRLPYIDRKKYIDKLNTDLSGRYHNLELFKFFIKENFNIEKFSLRDIDKAYYYIRILLPLIKPFNTKGPNENNIWGKTCILTLSYIYSNLITIKIKNPSIYNKVINHDYEVEDLIKNFKKISIEQSSTKIGGWAATNITGTIEPMLKMYFTLALKIHKEGRAELLNEDDYLVGLKQNDRIVSGWEFSLLWLFTSDELNINNKLEFIESFSNQDMGGTQ